MLQLRERAQIVPFSRIGVDYMPPRPAVLEVIAVHVWNYDWRNARLPQEHGSGDIVGDEQRLSSKFKTFDRYSFIGNKWSSKSKIRAARQVGKDTPLGRHQDHIGGVCV